jgi:glycosyltransferase involved in cell wall biosynthesis
MVIEMKKLIFYIYSLNKGGAERVLLSLAEGLKKDYDILILTDDYAPREYELPEGIRRISVSDYVQGNAFWRLREIRRICLREDADVIIAFMLNSAARMLIAVCGSGIPVFSAIRANPFYRYGSPRKRAWMNLVLAGSRGIICQTEEQCTFFWSALRKKITVIANPVSESFAKMGEKQQWDNRIVTAGRMYSYKNHGLLIRAFARLTRDYPEITLTIYGDGPYREETGRLIQELGIESRVELPGDVEQVAEKICSARIFALPSDTEGMPNALIEAMALGLPCVATDCPGGGPGSLIRDGVNGFLCRVGDVEDMEAKIRLLLSDPALCRRMGKEAAKIKEDCSREKICSQWREWIEK